MLLRYSLNGSGGGSDIKADYKFFKFSAFILNQISLDDIKQSR